MEGIRSYGRYYEVELDEGIGIKIDLNNANRNEYILMNLLGSGGTINPIGINLIYSHRSSQEDYDFGKKLKLSDYKKFTIIDSTKFKLENSDDSVDNFEKIGAEYKNNELKLKATLYQDFYQEEIYDIGLETKDGLEIDLNSEKRYPTLISKDNKKTSYSYNGSNLLTKISNNSEDYFEFKRSGNNVIEIDQNKKGNIINRVFFTYLNNTISGIEIKNYNQETIRKYSFSISSNLIEIINLISGKRIKISIANNKTTIESGYQVTYEKKRTETITYLDGKTTVSLSNGEKNYYFYDIRNKIVSVIDGSNQVQITDYEGYKLKEKSRTLNIDSTTCSSLLKNGDFKEYKNHWSDNGLISFGNNTNVLSSLYTMNLILKPSGKVSQTIAYKGTSLETLTMYFLYEGDSVVETTYMDVSITLKNNETNEEEKVSKRIEDILFASGLRFHALSIKPTKRFDQIKIEFHSLTGTMYITGIKLVKTDGIVKYSYNSEEEVYKLTTNNQENRINVNKSGRVESGNINNYCFNNQREETFDSNNKLVSSKKTNILEFGVKTIQEYDEYAREIKKTIKSKDEEMVFTNQYSQDDLIKDSDSFVKQEYEYGGNSNLLVSETKTEGNKTSYTYNNRELVNKLTENNKSVSYKYNVKDELISFGNINCSYTNYETINNISILNKVVTSFTYNSKNLMTNKNYVDSKVEYVYDTKERISQVKIKEVNDQGIDEVKKTYGFTYNGNNNLTKVQDDGVSEYEYSYDNFGRVIKEYSQVQYSKYIYGITNEEICNTITNVNDKVLIKSTDPISKKSGKKFTSFKESMYRLATIDKYGSLYNQTYCCFFDDESMNLVNKKVVENNYEEVEYIEPKQRLTLTRIDEYDGIKTSSTKLLSYPVPSKYQMMEYCINVTFMTKFYTESQSEGYLLYIGQKGNKNDSIIIKYINENSKYYLKVYICVNNKEILINDSYEKGLIAEINKTGWNYVSLSVSQEKSSYNMIYQLIVNGKSYVFHGSIASYGVTCLSSLNPVISFGGFESSDGSISNFLSCGISSLMVTFNKNKINLIEEESLIQLERWYRKYHKYDESFTTSGKSYTVSGSSYLKLNKQDFDLYEIYPLNGSFESLKGKKPYDFKARNELRFDKNDYFEFSKTKKRYVYIPSGNYLEYQLDSTTSGTISIDTEIENNETPMTLFSLKFDTKIIKLTLCSSYMYIYEKNSSGGYTSLGRGLISNGERRISFTWNYTGGTNISINLLCDDLLVADTKTSFNSLPSKSSLLLGLDYEEKEPYYLFVASLVTSTQYMGNSITNITSKIKEAQINHEYDKFNLLVSKKVYSDNPSGWYRSDITYKTYNSKKTKYIDTEKIRVPDKEYNITYNFIKNGSPTSLLQSITTNNVTTTYEYDGNNRLVSESIGSTKTTYTYDDYGNILTKGNITYDYDANKQLIKYGNKELRYSSNNIHKLEKIGTFDSNGNLLSGQRYSYLGNKISEIYVKDSDTTLNFKYDYQGRRKEKIVNNNDKIQYIYLNGLLEAEVHNNYTLRFLYDENNDLYGLYYCGLNNNDKSYFYVKNALGIIIGLIAYNGAFCVEYRYDAWGNFKAFDSDGKEVTAQNHIGIINPFVYKSYYYDKETGLYYLMSRYYNPELCRFISPDSVDYLDPGSINGINLYAYCGNDPVNYSDGSGHFPILCTLLFLGGLGALTSIASQAVTDIIYGNEFDINNYLIAAGAGFIGGLCYAIPGVGGIVAGAVTSGLTTAGQMIYSGEDYTIADYIINVGMSTVIGGLTSWAFGKATSGLSYFADTDFFLSNLVKFAGNYGGITLQNSVITQLMGQLIVRGVVTGTISNMFGSIFQEIPSKSSDYYHLRKMGLNPWDSFRYAFF